METLVSSPPDSMNADGNQDIWPLQGVRAFISHLDTYANVVGDLKHRLEYRGINAFFASDGIKPARQWPEEIMRALKSAHVTIALMTSDFQDSDWTDQEIGISLGMNIPVFPIRVGDARLPYGFISSSQGLHIPDFDRDQRGQASRIASHTRNNRGQLASAPDIPIAVLRYLLAGSTSVSSSVHFLAVESFIEATRKSGSFYSSNELAPLLKDINSLTASQEHDLVKAINENGQALYARDFRPRVQEMLLRVTGNHYADVRDNTGNLAVILEAQAK